MNKTIWLINAYAMPPYKEQRIQTLKRAEYLQKKGFEVYIITGSNFHNSDENLISDNSLFVEMNYDGLKYIHVRTSNYKNSNLLRIFSLLQFYFRLFEVIKLKKKPDFISLYAAIPFSNIVYFLAKKYKCKLILDVVDLWPESLLELGLISKYNPFLWVSYFAEKWMYDKADLIVFSMEGGRDYLIEKKWDRNSGGRIDLNKVKYINNGVDLIDFNVNKNQYKIVDNDLDNEDIFKVVYMGSIRMANGLDLLLNAAKELSHIKEIKFLIYGSGPERIKIQNRIKLEGIENVILKQEWVELKYVPYILSKSSLNLLNYAKSKIWRFGGSQSKSFQYMASGKPIVSNVKMSYCPITKYNLGISKEFRDAKEYSDAILSIYSLDKDKYNEMCNNSLVASKNYNYEDLTNNYIDYCLN